MDECRIAILGSSRGTSSQPLIDALKRGEIPNARIVLVVSNKPDALILERAREHGLPSLVIPTKGKTREQFDSELVRALHDRQVTLLHMVGFSRIVTPVLVNAFRHRITNVHPSLLPRHGGLNDLDVHRAVLAAGDVESGCTLHLVDVEVDAGPILIQRKVPVRPDDTPETLKARVQAEEGLALIQATRAFAEGRVRVVGRTATLL